MNVRSVGFCEIMHLWFSAPGHGRSCQGKSVSPGIPPASVQAVTKVRTALDRLWGKHDLLLCMCMLV